MASKAIRPIMFTGGGTLGSVMPLVAIATALQARIPSLSFLWCGTFRGIERTVIHQPLFHYYPLINGKWRRYFSLMNLVDPFLVLFGFLHAFLLLVITRPAAVVTAGGFVGVPLIWAAWLLRIPRVVLQIDVAHSMASNLTFPFATIRGYVFPPRMPFSSQEGEHRIPFPVREPILMIPQRKSSPPTPLASFRLRPSMPTILVMGGGIGAAALNDAIVAVQPQLLTEANIIHVTGIGGTAAPPAPGYFSAPLLGRELLDAFAIADIAISRAGISSIAEYAAAGLAPILVPLPRSAQEANALFLVRHDAAVVVEQTTSLAPALLSAAQKLLRDARYRSNMCTQLARALPVDNGENAAALVLAAAGISTPQS